MQPKLGLMGCIINVDIEHAICAEVSMTKRHTTVNLDMDLVREAQQVLGTTHATETIHRALREVTDRDKRRRLLEMGIGDLTPCRLEEIRRNRSFDGADARQSA